MIALPPHPLLDDYDDTPDQMRSELAALVRRGLTVEQAAGLVGCSPSLESESRTLHYLPTPAEIKAATKAIRAGWSDDERRRREGKDGTRYAIPFYQPN